MKEIIKSKTFDKWLRSLRDIQAGARIEMRLRRLSLGHFGDVKPVGDGLSELRIDYGPGYRVYLLQDGAVLVLLLCGGDKPTQASDIERAKQLAREWRKEK